MTQTPAPPVTGGTPVEPDRSTVILVFGILSILLCFLFGIAAWVMANRDMEKIAAGTMDGSNAGMIKAGKVCGIVGIVKDCLGLCITAIWLIVAAGIIAGSAAGAGAGAGGP